MADEFELSRFREQWKEEVTARTHPQAASSSASASAAAARSHKPRLPSFSHARPTAKDTNVDDDDIVDELPVSSKHIPTSPPRAARQPSFSATTGVPKSALEHYEKAVEKEGEGNLGESLRLYRQAFRMDDAVDKAYKDKHFPRVPAAAAAAAAAANVPAHGKGKAVAARTPHVPEAVVHLPIPPGTSELVASFAGLAIAPIAETALAADDGAATTTTQAEEEDEEAEKKKFCLFAEVPSELLLHILRFTALADIASFARLAQVCKSLCYVVVTEDRIWRDVCKATFPRQVWDWKVSVGGHPLIDELLGGNDFAVSNEQDDNNEEEEAQRTAPVDEEQLPLYHSSWREMFHLRPRLRYNGVYISTCNYHRSGGHSGTSLSWGTPVHIVTYYRYLRFYPDGTLLSLLSTHEPADVVYTFSKLALPTSLHDWAPHVARGRWRVDSAGQVDIETEAQNLPRYLFRMQLRIREARGRMNTVRGGAKLNWEGFWSWNKLTDDLGKFEGRNDKPFFFSRVAAVEKEGVV
ncbi:hypothetical protein BZA05DRAFT_134748 [Tricharina praecox]|uniref:uncharacterized protein n=1 Tax=Tricharina praecox TaxID=43433 RepID=UPI00221FAB8D|nr:uncharacterized protein BZA05DRAFT_229268 [Tricharina praecox]XP_051336927.1 uncharacterized protein BZA05DRAFT_134748 [Tricharina praecox]KAI5841261.1 hypothetical protein BZA05DRAFT_229268 [Tricharina praecox]KAI5846721.1 hypothetical protein BZA05DRAFT_134748 [Tricharina praecox]